LADKNDALARSNAELEAFAYVASHDLREPLRNVTAFSTLLARQLEGRLNGEEQELLKILCDAAARMDSLVRDLLEVSRVGRGELDLRPVATAEVVAAALASLRVQMEAVDATVEVADTLPVVMGNADELYRVFLNVLGNCLKYRGERAPAIRIAASREAAAVWCLRVTDNGIGIEAGYGYEERIFGLFQRLHQRDQHGGGTGIGLTVCRKIINRHGGRMWAESEGLGKGTTIAFTLPAARG
jgi:light-regulated signal transduction histidine kinase (bacteriophytochrome)